MRTALLAVMAVALIVAGAAPAPSYVMQARLSAGHRVNETGWQVAPGLTYRSWDDTTEAGIERIHVLTAKLNTRGLVLDQISGPKVTDRATLSTLVAADRAVAAVNGDFFDINGTGAPLGLGRDRQRLLLHASQNSWGPTFVVTAEGKVRVMDDPLVASVKPRLGTAIAITNLNAPAVSPGGVGLYTFKWGTTSGRAVTGDATNVRQITVRGGVVTSNRTILSKDTAIVGQVLIGRGEGADKLAALRKGTRVRIAKRLATPLKVAIGGSVRLLRAGAVTVTDDVALHPRTAVGYDRDTNTLHLVVVDGRSESSSGTTLVGLARLMASLGDDEALNLDGGGSSTMVAADASGVVGLRNSPSGGRERRIPNALGFRYVG